MSTREQAANELRAKITATEPELLGVIDGLKETFGARLKYVQLSDGTEIGNRKEFELAGFNPARYEAPKASKQGSLKGWLKEQEDAHLATVTQQARAGSVGRSARGRRPGVGRGVQVP